MSYVGWCMELYPSHQVWSTKDMQGRAWNWNSWIEIQSKSLFSTLRSVLTTGMDTQTIAPQSYQALQLSLVSNTSLINEPVLAFCEPCKKGNVGSNVALELMQLEAELDSMDFLLFGNFTFHIFNPRILELMWQRRIAFLILSQVKHFGL